MLNCWHTGLKSLGHLVTQIPCFPWICSQTSNINSSQYFFPWSVKTVDKILLSGARACELRETHDSNIHFFSIIVKSRHHHSFICSYFYKNQSIPNNPSLVACLCQKHIFSRLFSGFVRTQEVVNPHHTWQLCPQVITQILLNICASLFVSICLTLNSLGCFSLYTSSSTASEISMVLTELRLITNMKLNCQIIPHWLDMAKASRICWPKLGINQNLKTNPYYHSF